MKWPRWLKENRVFALIQIGLSIGGSWLITWAFSHFTAIPALALPGIALIVAAAILWAAAFLPSPPDRRKEQRPGSAPSSLPPGLLESSISPRGRINTLIHEGESIKKGIPKGETPSPIVVALAGNSFSPAYHFKRMAGWEGRVWEMLHLSAPAFTSLFTHDETPGMNYQVLDAYMAARLAELREILKKL